MTIRKDLILHALVGLAVVPWCLAIQWVATHVGLVYAIDLVGLSAALGKEALDKFMKTGVADPMDAIVTIGATVAAAHSLHVLGVI